MTDWWKELGQAKTADKAPAVMAGPRLDAGEVGREGPDDWYQLLSGDAPQAVPEGIGNPNPTARIAASSARPSGGGFGSADSVLRAAGRVADMGKAGIDAAKGMAEWAVKSPAEELPEIKDEDFTSVAQGGKIALSLFLDGDDKYRSEVIRKAVPGAIIRDDKDGHKIVRMPDGKEYYINRPGVSGQDAFDVFHAIAPYAAAGGALGGLGKAVVGTPGRVAGTAIGNAGAAFGTDAGSSLMGSGRNPMGAETLTKAAVAGVLGGVMEAFPGGFAALKRRFSGAKIPKLTAVEKARLKRAGVDPASLTTETMQELKAILPNARNAQEALRHAEARGLNRGLTLTEGQGSQAGKAQFREAQWAKGVGVSDDAAGMFRQSLDDQEEAMRTGIRNVQGRIGKGEVQVPGEGMEQVQAAAAAGREKARQFGSRAYQKAESAGAKWRESIKGELGKAIDDGMETFDLRGLPSLKRLADDVRGPTQETTMAKMEAWRQRVNRYTQSANPMEATAARRMISTYDDFMEGLGDDMIMAGDEMALKKFKVARRLWARMKDTYDKDKIFSKMIHRESGEFVQTPQEAVRFLFGANNFNKPGALGALRKMKTALGDDSAEWGLVREEAFLHMLRNQGQGFVLDPAAKIPVSGAAMRKAWHGAKRDAPKIIDELFTQEQQKQIDTMVRVAGYRTDKVPGTDNFSNSATWIRKLGFVGKAADFITSSLGMHHGKQLMRKRAVEDALNPLMPKQPTIGEIGERAAIAGGVAESR